jgi:hypothetical protein
MNCIQLQQTNFTTSDETMTGGSGILPQEVWKQRREATTRQGGLPTNQKRIRWSQEGINQYQNCSRKQLFKVAVLNRKKSWAINFDRCTLTEGSNYRNASVEDKKKTKAGCRIKVK